MDSVRRSLGRDEIFAKYAEVEWLAFLEFLAGHASPSSKGASSSETGFRVADFALRGTSHRIVGDVTRPGRFEVHPIQTAVAGQSLGVPLHASQTELFAALESDWEGPEITTPHSDLELALARSIEFLHRSSASYRVSEDGVVESLEDDDGT